MKIGNKRLISTLLVIIIVLTALFSNLACAEQTADNSGGGSPEVFTTTIESESPLQTTIAYKGDVAQENHTHIRPSEIPEYSGEAYVAVNGNEPAFSQEELTDKYFENYAVLDGYGRCGVAFACLGRETMPTEERGAIGYIKPTGWHTVKYDCVDGKYLYNRCHLIGFQLSGENANKRNLITGTRYMNIDGMLPFENMVADYIEETDNHVMYRVTPVFYGDDLVARGVQMEALSVEDGGDGISFNVFCYNVQPGVVINYATGESESE